MSLVGPRPESPDRVRQYSEWQRKRLTVRPGITGLAQVNGLRDQHASEDKTRFDLLYVLEWNPLMDLLLLFRTIATLGKRCVPVRGWRQAHAQPVPSRRRLRKVMNADRT
jgi:lipopolysaccharide/colanic/teichoic acid biosynthesis glycosyltransferase